MKLFHLINLNIKLLILINESNFNYDILYIYLKY